MFSKPSAHINLQHLQHNANLARKHAPHSKLLAVVKANAYGHGVHEVAKTLSVADGFAVARFDEAIELRRSESKPILILGGVYTNNELDSCLQHVIDVVVHQAEQLELLCQHITMREKKISVWIKIDTGMHRLGIAPDQFSFFYEKLIKLSFVKSIVAMTHFANAEIASNTHTQSQIDLFHTTLKSFSDKKIQHSLVNSAGLLNWKISHGDWVRPGLMLYGINPNPENKLDLKPVMTLQAPIVSMRAVSKNEGVGYNLSWKALRESKIATVALGYGDGYPTQIKINTPVLINGKRAPIVGRVSMDLITVDCTDLSHVKTGDTVTFWGEDAEGNLLPVEEIAKQANTIPYDLVTKISGRVKYIY